MKEIWAAWALERYAARTADSEPAYPLGRDADGHLVHTVDATGAAAAGLARHFSVAIGLPLLRNLVLTARGLAITGRVMAGPFARSGMTTTERDGRGIVERRGGTS